MKLFSTNSAQHLATKIEFQQGLCTIKKFSDGEIFVRIDENVQDREIWVLAGTQAPAEHLFELFFLCNALERSGAKINLLITYFAYARQVVAQPTEACPVQVIGNIIKNFDIAKLFIIHPHSFLLHEFLEFDAVYNIDFFCKQAEGYDAIAAPDKGAFKLADDIARICKKDLVLINKMRPAQEQAKIISIDGQVINKKILLVDDIISTGRTITESAHALKKQGAASVAAAVTHGLFSPGSNRLIEQSPLERIYVTNTITQKSHEKVTVDDISKFIQKIMQQPNNYSSEV